MSLVCKLQTIPSNMKLAFSAVLLWVGAITTAQSKPHGHHHRKHKYQSPLGIPLPGPAFKISQKIHQTAHIPFVPHTAPQPFASWLGQQLDFTYVKPIFDALNATDKTLITRGESHITVITPPEFDGALHLANVTIDEINAIALKNHIQAAQFKIVCLGQEHILLDKEEYRVFSVLIDAPDLRKIREDVFRLFASKGGNTGLFDPHAFWPHITVGFNQRDLFIQDNIYKGYNACWRPIVEMH
ncbi:hypothetical protein BC938DRAFT_479639 [Jimgerdemannia flammicorona]|uniref:Swiss Army Knife 2H phosphoesterase domain-containing protein n=1 Tax=Jimgerdemannia flammicorona TaxID=994334 RepID=A0A433QKF1_9FUNG|nr:hypothetical protein BC938DRAFT_479639 [Jimgerdemannia flammicorona]